MGYYRECRRAFALIEELIRQQSGTITEADLVYAVTTKYEIGAFTVKKRIALLVELRKVEVKKFGMIHEVIDDEPTDEEQGVVQPDEEARTT